MSLTCAVIHPSSAVIDQCWWHTAQSKVNCPCWSLHFAHLISTVCECVCKQGENEACIWLTDCASFSFTLCFLSHVRWFSAELDIRLTGELSCTTLPVRVLESEKGAPEPAAPAAPMSHTHCIAVFQYLHLILSPIFPCWLRGSRHSDALALCGIAWHLTSLLSRSRTSPFVLHFLLFGGWV